MPLLTGLSRRRFLRGAGGALLATATSPAGPAWSQAAAPGAASATTSRPPVDATFLFTSDVHACLISADALSPDCAEQGKTDANLVRHVTALNALAGKAWPERIGGQPSGLYSAGQPIARPLGLVIAGDLTDDGGGQVKVPGEGWQLKQFANRYSQGSGPGQLAMPAYVGLGNHDIDQDGAAGHVDWYRRELRDYVEFTHRSTVFSTPPVPVGNYDVLSDSYSWDWGGLHLVQLQRFGGDRGHGAPSGLDWLKADLAASAADGRPVAIFQHYGWDHFSTEVWDPQAKTFDATGAGEAHWWSAAERAALVEILKPYRVVGLFHGHQHDQAMAYQADGLDIFTACAAFLGGFALVRINTEAMDVAFGEARDGQGTVEFTHAFTKPIA
ncbi:metallophosphoesterase [Xaviernesmea oryzae]|uniref:Metallophosphoesterase n=1 Tax=Xaviernesmea oryzae TaxID=464029 RepID=A0A1Q9AZ52_9HYPH|nr:metallophosphoesterase [Xaviernesmea oryzae]OLP60976.1 metallophosphoesterase [Xaviernesmea oryzae]SEL19260.1 Cytolysin, a secreted calcineurin-like phosphatase [Xaviernesmea oryzae]